MRCHRPSVVDRRAKHFRRHRDEENPQASLRVNAFACSEMNFTPHIQTSARLTADLKADLELHSVEQIGSVESCVKDVMTRGPDA